MNDDDEGKESDNDLLNNIPSIGMDAADGEHEDAFNKVMGGGNSKEKGGLLGSLGITKEETREAAKGIEDIDDLDDYDLEDMEP